MSHPVEGRAEVVDEFLAGVDGVHVGGQLRGLGNVRIAGLNPQEICVRGEFPSPLGCGREARAVVVEAFAGARDVAGPDDRGLCEVVGQRTATGERKIRVLLDLLLVRIAGRLRGLLGLQVGINS